MTAHEDPRLLAKRLFGALPLPGEAGVVDGSLRTGISGAFQLMEVARPESIPGMRGQVSQLPEYFRENAARRLAATQYPDEDTFGILASVLDAHDQATYLLESPGKLDEWNAASPDRRGIIVYHLDSRNVDMPKGINAIAHGYLVSLGKAVADPIS